MKITTKLDYGYGVPKNPNTVRIGGSSVGKFFTKRRAFFGDLLLEENSFKGNTASVTGTCVHYVCEQFHLHKNIPEEEKQEIENYIKKLTSPLSEDFNIDVDPDYVRAQFVPMATAIINEYLIKNPITHSEVYLEHKLYSETTTTPNITIGGTIDGLYLENPKYNGEAIFENLISADTAMIIDYKTKGSFHTSLPSETDTMDYSYKLQLLTYAYILNKKGIPIDRIRLIYVSKQELNRVGAKGKALTPYKSKTSTQTEVVTEDDLLYIENCINLIKDNIKLWFEKPELRYILANDYRLLNKGEE